MFFNIRAAPFKDRADAGQKLALELAGLLLPSEKTVVLALPRGGVPVAYEVAKALRAPLDLLMVLSICSISSRNPYVPIWVRKIGAPGDEEYGIGAVVEGNPPQLVMNELGVRLTHPTNEYIQSQTQRQLKEMERQRKTYLGGRAPIPLEGKVAVVVDDGIATGGTARVALKALGQRHVERAILAVPVGPSDTIEELRAEGNEVLCLETPPQFRAVGLHYAKFGQTSDDEVIQCMESAQKLQKQERESTRH